MSIRRSTVGISHALMAAVDLLQGPLLELSWYHNAVSTQEKPAIYCHLSPHGQKSLKVEWHLLMTSGSFIPHGIR